MPNWEEGNISFDEIRQKINLFTQWSSEIRNKIKDIPKGCLNINGIKISAKLVLQLEGKLDVYKSQLSSLMVKKMKTTK